MKKTKLSMIFLVGAALLMVLLAQAQSDEALRPKEVKQTAASGIKPAPVNTPEKSPFTDSRQGYQMVTDVLDSFGGEWESDNYRIPVSAGGQPSAVGISESDTLVIEAGFVHASSIRRGDVNADRVVNVGDVVYLVNYLYRGGPEPCPVEAGDVNCDGVVNVGDIVLLVNYLYRGGPPPAC
jgi:hypothetical protein